MFLSLDFERVSDDGLSRDFWRYSVLDTGLGSSEIRATLEQWSPQSRTTKRHKWVKAGEGYKRRRSNSYRTIGEEQLAASVPIPDGVEARVRAEILERIVIVHAVDPPDQSPNTIG